VKQDVMAKQKSAANTSFFLEMCRVGLYKRNQGKITRQVTFAAVAAVVALGCLRLKQQLSVQLPADYSYLEFAIPGGLLAAGLWISYRLVNLPRFADFLIAVEAEMNKVSWPTRTELFRSSLVVIIVIFVLAAILFGYDNLWSLLFSRVLKVM